MSADLPHTLYNSNKKKKQVEADVDEAIRLTREAAERKRKSMEAKQEYTIEEVFEGKADN